MRIVHCFRSPVGGIFRHVRDLCDAQISDGHELGIVCDSITGGELENRFFDEMEPRLSLGLFRTPMQRQIGLRDIASSWRTLQALRTMRPDILHGHSAKGGVYSRAFGTLMRLSGRSVARLYSPHGGTLHYSPGTTEGRVFFTIERLLEGVTDHLIFVSGYEERAYTQKVGVPKCPHSIVYNGLGASEFQPVIEAPDATDFLYVGMMRDLKGPDLFLVALKEVEKATGRAVTATLVGDGDDRDKYIAQAAALGLAERVRFRPAMPVRQAFTLGRLLVVPSRAEAMPYIVLEALAARKGIVTTNVGGIPEIFNEAADILASPTSSSLARQMTRAISDEATWRSLMPSDDDLKDRFSLATMAARTSTIYRESFAPTIVPSKT